MTKGQMIHAEGKGEPKTFERALVAVWDLIKTKEGKRVFLEVVYENDAINLKPCDDCGRVCIIELLEEGESSRPREPSPEVPPGFEHKLKKSPRLPAAAVNEAAVANEAAVRESAPTPSKQQVQEVILGLVAAAAYPGFCMKSKKSKKSKSKK